MCREMRADASKKPAPMVKIVIFTQAPAERSLLALDGYLYKGERRVFVRYAESAWSNDQEMEDLAIMSSSHYILGSGSSYSCLAAMVSGCDYINIGNVADMDDMGFGRTASNTSSLEKALDAGLFMNLLS